MNGSKLKKLSHW